MAEQDSGDGWMRKLCMRRSGFGMKWSGMIPSLGWQRVLREGKENKDVV